ncbi:MAG: hypothetical protein SV760_07960, partial [Halobacteria archaeon]|nr:hypothetical protein [Halobacteria archaeon]
EPEPETETTEDETEDDDTQESEAEEEAEDDEDDRPTSVEELEELSYRELQGLAKEVDVKANLKTEELIERIAEEYGIDEADEEGE